jgi:hypothetical protein
LIKLRKTKVLEGEYILALVKEKKRSPGKYKFIKVAEEQDLIDNGFIRKEPQRIGFRNE